MVFGRRAQLARILCAAALASSWIAAAAADPGALASLPDEPAPRLREALGSREPQLRLQAFVDAAYAKGFLHLGDERDFDHGHLLFAPSTGAAAPMAILYHTQELASLYHRSRPGGAYDYIDRRARNWLQWLDGSGRIEDARRYARTDYPDTPAWRVFRESELPRLRACHTVTDKMLDPAALGAPVARSVQWVFSRVGCPAPGADAPDLLHISLPTGERVCLRQSF